MRRELLEALKDRVAQIMGPDWFVEVWDGAESAFNAAGRWPAVYVAYTGCGFEDLGEIGVVTYRREFRFWVLVCTRDAAQALDALDALEKGLTGAFIAPTVSALVPDGDEELIAAELGHYLFAQSYACRELKTTA